MKYFSMFSGIGGFEYGIEQSHYEYARKCKESTTKEREQRRKRAFNQRSSQLYDRDRTAPLCVGYSEIDKYANAIYKYRYPTHKNYGDATNIDPGELPDFDMLVGGFPCQAFSIAGKRRGFEDTRGTLFFDIARIIKVKRPKIVLLENVKGLLNHDKGETFRVILQTMGELGYDTQWMVVNSKFFGVPQNRERTIIIGSIRGSTRPEILPFGASNGTINEDGGQRISNFSKREFGWKKISPAICARDYKDPKIVQLNNPTHSNDRLYDEEGISPALNTAQGGNRQPKIRAVLTPDRPTKRQNGRRFKEEGEPSFTLTGQDKHGVNEGTSIRRLTPLECERLQAFPDEWTKKGTIDGKEVEISDTQRYKTLGNAVTTNVIKAIVEKIYESI